MLERVLIISVDEPILNLKRIPQKEFIISTTPIYDDKRNESLQKILRPSLIPFIIIHSKGHLWEYIFRSQHNKPFTYTIKSI